MKEDDLLGGLDGAAARELEETLHSLPVPRGGSKRSAAEQGERLRGMFGIRHPDGTIKREHT